MIAALLAGWSGLQSRLILAVAVAGAVLLAVLGIFRAGRKSALADVMEKTADVQRKQLQALADRPADRADLARRMRDGRF